MSVVGEGMWIKLGLDTTGLQKGLGDAKTTLTGWRDETNKNIGEVKSWGTAIAATAAPIAAVGAAIYALTANAGEFGDLISDMSYTLGMSTDDLQKWRKAGVSTGTDFGALTQTMRMYSQRVSETGEAGDALRQKLKNVGVEVRDSNGNWKDTTSLMWDTVTALNEMPNAYERNNLAMDVYGRNWGSIAGLIKHADEAKIAFSKDPAYTEEEIELMHDYNIRLGELSASWGSISRQIGEEFIPAMEEVLPIIEDYGIPTVKALAGTLEWAGRGFHLLGMEAKWATLMATRQWEAATAQGKAMDSYVQAKLTSDALKESGYRGAKSVYDPATGKWSTPSDAGSGGSGGSGGGGGGGGGSGIGSAAGGTSTAAILEAVLGPNYGNNGYNSMQAAADNGLRGVGTYNSLLSALGSSGVNSSVRSQFGGLGYSASYLQQQAMSRLIYGGEGTQEWAELAASKGAVNASELAHMMLGGSSTYSITQSELDAKIKALLAVLSEDAKKQAAYQKAFGAGNVFNIVADNPLASAAAVSRVLASQLNKAGVT